MNCDDGDEYQYLEKMRIMLVGRTGRGKSAFGNSICGSQERNVPFLTGVSSSSVTQNVKIAYREYADRKLCVIDTPGLFDTNRSMDETMEQLIIGFKLATPGPHAFLIVLYGRCTDEDQTVLDLLQKKFGQYFLDYCIIIGTHEDEVRDNDKQLSDEQLIDKYFQEAPKILQDVLRKCNNRCILIDNRASFEDRDQKISILIKMIKQNEQNHANSYYNQEMFDQVERYNREWNNDQFDHQKKEWEKNEEEMREKIERADWMREARLRRYKEFNEVRRHLTQSWSDRKHSLTGKNQEQTTKVATKTLNIILDQIVLSSE